LNKKIHTLYFSATGTTEKVVTGIANKISASGDQEAGVHHVNFTLPEAEKSNILCRRRSCRCGGARFRRQGAQCIAEIFEHD